MILNAESRDLAFTSKRGARPFGRALCEKGWKPKLPPRAANPKPPDTEHTYAVCSPA